MSILPTLVLGATLTGSVWAIWSTVRPQARRIVDLLVHGPVVTPTLPAPVPARSNLRNVSVRRMPSLPAPAQPALRAAA